MDLSKTTQISATLDASGFKFALIVSRYNALVTKELLDGALDAITRHGGDLANQTIVWAPGGFEIPLLVKYALEKGTFDGVIALGCVMKGETPHNDYISSEVVKGIASLSLEYATPVSFGVLTPDTMEQALNRAGLKMGNKGGEAALAVIEMARLRRMLG